MAQTPKATRQYVALSFYTTQAHTHKPLYEVVYVGVHGVKKEHTEGVAKSLIESQYCIHFQETIKKNLFVVSLSVVKRSYKKAWRQYQESLQLEQAKKDTEGYTGNELYHSLR